MSVNPSKTKALIVSGSRTAYPVYCIVLNGAIVNAVQGMKQVGIILDSKLTYESLIRSIVASTFSRQVYFVKFPVFIVMLKLLLADYGLLCFP